MSLAVQPQLLPPAQLDALDRSTADQLLTEWGHYLGPCRRPFGVEAWGLFVAGKPVSLAVSASIVSSTVAATHAARWSS